jgi:PAT family beta-lactamase induction signal transducer AmpG
VPSLYLTESRWLRLTTFTALYLAQGVPIGLLTVAIPAWLAEQGVALAEIAAYTGVVGLPWAFKLVAGPFMDRFAFPPMGHRRPWVMGAQGGLTLAMLGLVLVPDPDPGRSLLPLMIGGFIVPCFSAVQDVAVDGMAIDVLPPDERGRANALMAFGQAGGFSLFAAISGALLGRGGLATAAVVCAVSVGLIFVFVTATRERLGERVLPWSEGRASPREVDPERNFRIIFRNLVLVLFLPMSLLLTLSETLFRFRDGIAISVLPTVAVQELGFSSEDYTAFFGWAGFLTAAVGIVFGPMIDRWGAKRLIILGAAGGALVSFGFAAMEPLWDNTGFTVGAWIAANLFTQVIFIGMIAQYMNICWSPVAATQFAIYMSLANLTRSIGAGLFALVAADLSFAQDFALMGALLSLGVLSMLLFDIDAHRARLAALSERAVSPVPTPLPTRS